MDGLVFGPGVTRRLSRAQDRIATALAPYAGKIHNRTPTRLRRAGTHTPATLDRTLSRLVAIHVCASRAPESRNSISRADSSPLGRTMPAGHAPARENSASSRRRRRVSRAPRGGLLRSSGGSPCGWCAAQGARRPRGSARASPRWACASATPTAALARGRPRRRGLARAVGRGAITGEAAVDARQARCTRLARGASRSAAVCQPRSDRWARVVMARTLRGTGELEGRVPADTPSASAFKDAGRQDVPGVRAQLCCTSVGAVIVAQITKRRANLRSDRWGASCSTRWAEGWCRRWRARRARGRPWAGLA